MSGDSPNAFTNDNVFDFKEGRSSPAPTSSKEHHDPVVASVLVEPPKEKGKDKDNKDKDAHKEEDEPDFSTPILNPGADKNTRRHSDADKTLEINDPKNDGSDKGKDRGKDRENDPNKEEHNLLNGKPDKLPNPYGRKPYEEDTSDDDSCIVNCIYYTMECCKCTIL